MSDQLASTFTGETVSPVALQQSVSEFGLPDNDSSSLLVTPTGSLIFQKDILVSSRPGGGNVTISTVDNFVDQVPEPASATLLCLGGGLLLARRRRA